MVELRKRKAPAEPAPAPPAAKKSNPPKSAAKKNDATAPAEKETPASTANGTTSAKGKLTVGEPIALNGFGGEVETQDGEKTTLKKLVDESKGGVVLFTYPKASTPGCKFSPFSPSSHRSSLHSRPGHLVQTDPTINHQLSLHVSG